MNDVLVSICVPAYNGADFLRQCLDSCIHQTYRNIEILVIDDVSSDDTLHIANEYAQSDQRVKVVKNEKNLGLVGNWNRCIDRSQGEWIKFVFQDDYLELDCIQKFVAVINESTQLVVSKRSFILLPTASPDERDYYTRRLTTIENTCGLANGNEIPADVISKVAAENIAMNFIGEPSLIFFRKTVVSTIGLFNSNLAQLCDLEFNLRVATNFGLTYIPEQLCHFRIHHGSTTTKNVEDKSYILSNIEPIVLVRELLYGGAFQRFRESIQNNLLLKLNSYFKVRTYEAAQKANESKANRSNFDMICNKLPEIKQYANASIATKLMYQLIVLRRKIRNFIF